jgi:regulator of cell morphogenesis and NO signaling
MNTTVQIDPIEELLKEHKDVVGELEVLEAHLRQLEKKITPEKDDVEKLMGWLATFEKHINLHIDKEDNVLFTALEKYIPRHGGPLAVMEMEHRGVESHIEKFQQGLKEGILLQPGTLNPFCENGFAMIDLLQAHLGKEEMILFPMANNVLTADEKNGISEKFQVLNSKAE